jgi:putative cardiolipin synthase
MFVIDRQKVFIGSMNLDPRSVRINTEIGLLIDSPELAWIEHRDGESIRYDKEPETTFWKRFGVGFIGLVPVDSPLFPPGNSRRLSIARFRSRSLQSQW